MAIEFTNDFAITNHEKIGLQWASRGNFPDAFKEFALAQRIAKLTASTTRDIPSGILQLACLDRLIGFTLANQAITEHSTSLLDGSYRKIMSSELATGSLIAAGQEQYSDTAWDQLQREHNLTLTAGLGVRVVNFVFFDRAVTVIPAPTTC